MHVYKDSTTSEIKTGVESFKADGYTDINIKGVYRMQGESDKDTPDEYKEAFKIFVDDFYIIASGKLQINTLVNGANKPVAGDTWHWSTADIFEIGCMIGECITENILTADGQ